MNKKPLPYPATLPWKLLEGGFRLTGLLFIPEFLLLLNRIFKLGTRRLTVREIELARSVFGGTVDYRKVRVDERSYIGCRQYHFAYVGFNVINCWGKLSDAHFIHEMVHVWQYQHLGPVYIPRALWAQRTVEGYDYGGVEHLRRVVEEGRGFLDFNYEQQGDIVADYFCLKNGIKPRWCLANPAYLAVFEDILKELYTFTQPASNIFREV